MARFFDTATPDHLQGSLMIEKSHADHTKVYFLPSSDVLKQAGRDDDGKTLILEVYEKNKSVCIHPISTWPNGSIFYRHRKFLQCKYKVLKTITIDNLNYFSYGCTTDDQDISDQDILAILEELPTVFVKDYDYGLGFRKDYDSLVYTLENWGVKHLVISRVKKTIIDEKNATLTLPFAELEKIRKATNRITNSARAIASGVKKVDVNNHLSNLLDNPEKYPLKENRKVKNKELANLITKESATIDIGLTGKEQKEAVSIVTRNSKKIAEELPEVIAELRNTIELVSFEKLITHYELMLHKKLKESDWQKLFQQNPFILSMAFSSPITIIQEQVNVGGVSIDGSGGKIGDFLVANSISHNATIIEIKKPKTPLLNKTAYRKNIYNASTELSGAINQVLDQRMEFQQDINRLKAKSKDVRFESYYTTGVLIIGTMPSDEDRQKSFELFRKNSKDVVIITFDELLGKIKQLLGFLKENTDDTIKK